MLKPLLKKKKQPQKTQHLMVHCWLIKSWKSSLKHFAGKAHTFQDVSNKYSTKQVTNEHSGRTKIKDSKQIFLLNKYTLNYASWKNLVIQHFNSNAVSHVQVSFTASLVKNKGYFYEKLGMIYFYFFFFSNSAHPLSPPKKTFWK